MLKNCNLKPYFSIFYFNFVKTYTKFLEAKAYYLSRWFVSLVPLFGSYKQGIVVHSFNSTVQEPEAGRKLWALRLA